jgi:ABC-type sugar transport system permease subunit
VKRFFLIIVVLTMLIPSAVYAQGTDPWSEIFQPDGNLNPDLIDLGVTTDHPDWMSI